jgi:hypothetical protein
MKVKGIVEEENNFRKQDFFKVNFLLNSNSKKVNSNISAIKNV